MTKAEKATICKCIDGAERELRDALGIYKQKGRTGKDLDGLKEIEMMIQVIEAWRLGRSPVPS